MSDGTETVTKAKETKEKAGQAKEAVTSGSKDADGGSRLGSLASKAVIPVAAAAGTLVSSYAAKKVPDLLRDRGGEEAEKLGKRALEGVQGAASQSGGIAGKAAEKLLGGGGDDDDGESGGGQPAKGWGRGRRLPIQCSVEVAVPIEVAYDQWTQFEEFPEFMHRVEQIEQKEDETIVWHENVWGVRRSWESQIVEQVPDERIVWRSDDRGGHSGVVTFHELSDRLTRVELNVDFQPEGIFEKLASGLRFHRRAVKTDLQRYKAFVEMRNEETGAWRGEIHDEGENPARRPPRITTTATVAAETRRLPRTAIRAGRSARSVASSGGRRLPPASSRRVREATGFRILLSGPLQVDRRRQFRRRRRPHSPGSRTILSSGPPWVSEAGRRSF